MFKARYYLLVLSIALGFFAPNWAHAISCNRTFLNSTNVLELDLSGHELSKWEQINRNFEAAKSKLDPQTQKKLEEIWDGFLFFDYTHTQPRIIEAFLNKQPLTNVSLRNLYGDRRGAAGVVEAVRRLFTRSPEKPDTPEFKGPFQNYREAQAFLQNKKGARASEELLKEIHAILMKGGIEDIKKHQLGVYREVSLIGNAYGSRTVTREEISNIESNPYLGFELHRKVGDKNEGYILYPHPGNLKPEAFARLKSVNPDIARRVEILKATGKKESQEFNGKIHQEVLEALVKERFIWFENSVRALGKIEFGKNHLDYADLVAQFQRDLVSIHPFRNGNGRTTRVFMNFLLTEAGMPPARLLSPDLDVQYSLQYWQRAIRKGIQNSLDIKRDLAERMENGLSTSNSSVVLYPALPESVMISQKKSGSSKEVTYHRMAEVDKNQFSAFVAAKLQLDPSLKSKINSIETLNKLAEEFSDFQRSKIIDFIHQKDGERELRQKLVDLDFMGSFGVVKSHDKAAWNYKINRWYDQTMLVWRGLSNKTHEYTDAELLRYFVQLNGHMASNRVAATARSQETFRKEMLKDFEAFNRDLLTGDYIKMAHDHSTTGPLYGSSYGLSTSKNEQVGKAFAMGAMVIADYGKHRDPELQQLLKSRINIATYRAEKDLDLGRVKPFNPEFSYEYGRQQEVMAIGGADADAVMIVQRINAQGEVQQSFVRDAQNPHLVHKIKGRYVHTEGPLNSEMILQTYDLRKLD